MNVFEILKKEIMNDNKKELKNKGIIVDLVLVVCTIIIPIFLIKINIEGNLLLVPIFILLLFLFYRVSENAHKLYLNKEEKEISAEIEKEKKLLW